MELLNLPVCVHAGRVGNSTPSPSAHWIPLSQMLPFQDVHELKHSPRNGVIPFSKNSTSIQDGISLSSAITRL